MLKSGVYLQLAPVLFGSGTHKQAGEKAKELGMTKAMLVTDEGIERLGHAGKIADSLKEAGLEVVIWNELFRIVPKTQLRKLLRYVEITVLTEL